MSLRRIYIAVAVFAAIVAPGVGADNYLHHHIDATILVAEPDKTADQIATWAEGAGGYFLLKASARVVIRFPAGKLPDLRLFLESVADEVIEISPQAIDLREQLLRLESGIRSREEFLQQNLSYINKTDVEGTLAIETEIVQILKEIEDRKGQLRRLGVDRRLSKADIRLSFMEQSLPEDIPSSFEWINTVDFYRFLRGGF